MEIVPLRDALLPPFTSKVTRTAFAALWGLDPETMGRRASFSVLFRGDRPLYKLAGEEAPLLAREGEVLRARVSMLWDGAPGLPRQEAVFVFGAAEMRARVAEVEVFEASALREDVPEKFALRFLTPTLVPVPGRGSLLKAGGPRRRYRLVPDLPLALAHLAYDAAMRGVRLAKATPGRIHAWALRALAELDYDARPVTALYTVRDGKPATERGFVGFVAYELLDTKSEYAEDFRRLMAFALRFGIGRSRSIGFGHVEMSPLGPPRRLRAAPRKPGGHARAQG